MGIIKTSKDLLRPTYYKIVHGHVKKTVKLSWDEFESYSNKYQGKSCFIVANGPSLKLSDLDCIEKNHFYSFGMNRIYKIYSSTNWRPSFYVVQDPTIIRNCHGELCRMEENSVVFAKSPGEKRYDIPKAIYYDVNYSRSWNGKVPAFSNGKNHIFEDGKTVAFGAMQLAVYMGFNPIYLIGFDCSYSKDNKVIDSNSYADPRMFDKKAVGQLPDIDYQFWAYSVAKDFCDANGIKIYNATRGGMLEVFDRISFEDAVLSNSNKE